MFCKSSAEVYVCKQAWDLCKLTSSIIQPTPGIVQLQAFAMPRGHCFLCMTFPRFMLGNLKGHVPHEICAMPYY